MNITHLVMFKFLTGASASAAVDVLSIGKRAATPQRGLIANEVARGLIAKTPQRGLISESIE